MDRRTRRRIHRIADPGPPIAKPGDEVTASVRLFRTAVIPILNIQVQGATVGPDEGGLTARIHGSGPVAGMVQVDPCLLGEIFGTG